MKSFLSFVFLVSACLLLTSASNIRDLFQDSLSISNGGNGLEAFYNVHGKMNRGPVKVVRDGQQRIVFIKYADSDDYQEAYRLNDSDEYSS